MSTYNMIVWAGVIMMFVCLPIGIAILLYGWWNYEREGCKKNQQDEKENN